MSAPKLSLLESGGVRIWTDRSLSADAGIVVAFSERTGGVSEPPYATLNLAAHVGDESQAVDENRRRFLSALGIGERLEYLTCAEQVHSVHIAEVKAADAGAGACAAGGPVSFPATDALLTAVPGIPLLLCYADCVPVVLVAPGPAVAVVHAGWRGVLGGIVSDAAAALAARAGCGTEELSAYIGAHIGACHYPVGDELLSHFVGAFGKVARARFGGLDLASVVRKSLTTSGVSQWRITSLDVCTAEETARFFSYRAEGGVTGRHGALAYIEPTH